jgi:tetratricopeptide (TPR) repeat protein
MSDPGRSVSAPLPSATAPEFLATFALILLAIVAFLFLDEWLAKIDRDESRAHAANLYAEGRTLLATHDADAASNRFASAVAIERTNTRYEVALAEAMLADGRTEDADETLESVLARAESDGAANLLMARVLVREGRRAEAKSFYHRAVYGRWGADSLAQRLSVRFELIDLLVREGAQAELLAELLPLQDLPADSVALRRTVGRLFVAAGSPVRGADMLRDILQRSPDDGIAYEGMGDAALALGNFRTARADLAIASRLLPHDTSITERLALVDTVLALDPMQRGIGERERAARSRVLLESTLGEIERCGGAAPTSATVDSARLLLAPSASPHAPSVDPDHMLALAAELWAARPRRCPGAVSARERALAILHARLAS